MSTRHVHLASEEEELLQVRVARHHSLRARVQDLRPAGRVLPGRHGRAARTPPRRLTNHVGLPLTPRTIGAGDHRRGGSGRAVADFLPTGPGHALECGDRPTRQFVGLPELLILEKRKMHQ